MTPEQQQKAQNGMQAALIAVGGILYASAKASLWTGTPGDVVLAAVASVEDVPGGEIVTAMIQDLGDKMDRDFWQEGKDRGVEVVGAMLAEEKARQLKRAVAQQRVDQFSEQDRAFVLRVLREKGPSGGEAMYDALRDLDSPDVDVMYGCNLHGLMFHMAFAEILWLHAFDEERVVFGIRGEQNKKQYLDSIAP